ncbi:MAG: hypothetical protein JWM86_815 [Thermoleophilia bacterium]|nr:hypothetical protein [Thermoleophilia bacterium]
MRTLRDNALTIAFLLLTGFAVVGQAIAGLKLENAELTSHGDAAVSMAHYLGSSSFGVDLLENWQSEFMQFTTFIFVTVWLAQRGSAEGKAAGDEGLEETRPPGFRGFARAHGLLLVMLTCFIATWAGQYAAGWSAYNAEQRLHGDPALAFGAYVTEPEFWSRTLQNWQSEFLAVAAMAVFTVYLRELGSPESKRLETPNTDNEPTY